MHKRPCQSYRNNQVCFCKVPCVGGAFIPRVTLRQIPRGSPPSSLSVACVPTLCALHLELSVSLGGDRAVRYLHRGRGEEGEGAEGRRGAGGVTEKGFNNDFPQINIPFFPSVLKGNLDSFSALVVN